MKSQSNGSVPVLDIGIYGRPCFGERVSGDFAFADKKDSWVFFAMIDGLGHGKSAHHISQLTKEHLLNGWNPDVKKTLTMLHENLQGTIGAAIGLASLNLETRILSFVGIGNTVFRRFGMSPVRLFSTEGTVGVRMRIPNEQRMKIEDSDLILLNPAPVCWPGCKEDSSELWKSV
jgi:hypothetical protein